MVLSIAYEGVEEGPEQKLIPAAMMWPLLEELCVCGGDSSTSLMKWKDGDLKNENQMTL